MNPKHQEVPEVFYSYMKIKKYYFLTVITFSLSSAQKAFLFLLYPKESHFINFLYPVH